MDFQDAVTSCLHHWLNVVTSCSGLEDCKHQSNWRICKMRWPVALLILLAEWSIAWRFECSDQLLPDWMVCARPLTSQLLKQVEVWPVNLQSISHDQSTWTVASNLMWPVNLNCGQATFWNRQNEEVEPVNLSWPVNLPWPVNLNLAILPGLLLSAQRHPECISLASIDSDCLSTRYGWRSILASMESYWDGLGLHWNSDIAITFLNSTWWDCSMALQLR